MRRVDRGFITAETAVALPALVFVLGAVLWGVAVVTAQLRCVDAARAGARALARGEPAEASRSAAAQAAPRAAQVGVAEAGDLVRVQVAVTVHPPGPLLSRLPGVRVTGDAVAAREDTDVD